MELTHASKIIMFSDLGCDYINPIDLCNKLNQVCWTSVCVWRDVVDWHTHPLSLSFRKTLPTHSSLYFSSYRLNGPRSSSTFLWCSGTPTSELLLWRLWSPFQTCFTGSERRLICMTLLKSSGLWAVTRKRPFSNWVFTFFVSSTISIGRCFCKCSAHIKLIPCRMIVALIAESEWLETWLYCDILAMMHVRTTDPFSMQKHESTKEEGTEMSGFAQSTAWHSNNRVTGPETTLSWATWGNAWPCCRTSILKMCTPIYTSLRGKIRAGTTVSRAEWGFVCPSALIICASPSVCHTHVHGLLSLCWLRR